MIAFGHILSRPRRKLFRHRVQPERVLVDILFGLVIVGASLFLLFLAEWAIGAIFHKEPCPFYDAKRGWGHDEAGRTCVRRPG